MTNQTNAISQHFHVALFITLYKMILTLTSMDETLVCDHSNESYREVLSFVYNSVPDEFNFRCLDSTLL